MTPPGKVNGKCHKGAGATWPAITACGVGCVCVVWSGVVWSGVVWVVTPTIALGSTGIGSIAPSIKSTLIAFEDRLV
jgi:hypothetical protein